MSATVIKKYHNLIQGNITKIEAAGRNLERWLGDSVLLTLFSLVHVRVLLHSTPHTTYLLSGLLEFEDCGKHCHSWEFWSLSLDRQFWFLLAFFTHLQGAAVHWPNRIYHCSGSGTSISENLNNVPTFEHSQQLNWAFLRDSKHLTTQTN